MKQIRTPVIIAAIVILVLGILTINLIGDSLYKIDSLELEDDSELSLLAENVTQILIDFEFESDDFKYELENDLIKQRDGVDISYPYKYYQLEVSPYGSRARFLSDFKDELIQSFKEEFTDLKYQWQVGQEEIKLTLDLKIEAKGEEINLYTIEFIQPRPQAKMAIIIDDLGLGWSGLDEILSIPRRLTMAVLAGKPDSLRQANLAKDKGYEVMLHQAMEPDDDSDPGPNAIYTDMDEEEIQEVLRDNINSLPEIAGINNHMGSKATTDEAVVGPMVEVLAEKGLYFIDSGVASDSVVTELSETAGVDTARNYYFIDNVDDKELIKENLLNLAHLALDRGELIVIGHVRENTALAIKEAIPILEEKGISLVYASRLVK